jgi:hypothetical protein
MSSSDDFGFTFTFLRNKEFLNDKINEIDKKIMQTYFLDCATIVNKSKQFARYPCQLTEHFLIIKISTYYSIIIKLFHKNVT